MFKRINKVTKWIQDCFVIRSQKKDLQFSSSNLLKIEISSSDGLNVYNTALL
jgi:hypothetical protein